MARDGTYYLARIIKIGSLSTQDIRGALREPQSITRYGSAWTFLDTKEYTDGRSIYVFGKLAKYDPEAEVSVVDPDRRTETRRREPNMTIASSPFIYVPDFSGISFLHVSNNIDYEVFMKRWSDVVNCSHNQLLAKCEVEPIADLQSFAAKLKSMDGIFRLSATVSPPNPLFGSLWKNLKEYLEERNAGSMRVEEDSGRREPLATALPDHVESIVEQTEGLPYDPGPLPIGDAAILMAADGYGKGYVQGRKGDRFVKVRTSDSVQNFTFSRDPKPEDLYKRTVELLEKVSEERNMEH